MKRLINITQHDWDRAAVIAESLPYKPSRAQLLSELIRSGLNGLENDGGNSGNTPD